MPRGEPDYNDDVHNRRALRINNAEKSPGGPGLRRRGGGSYPHGD